jgi:hypothetical protein
VSALRQEVEAPRRRPLAVYRNLRHDLIEVSVDGGTVGFIERAGNVFVALRGDRYDRAVEVGQSVSIEVVHHTLCNGGAE